MKTTTAEATCLPLRRDTEQAVPPGGSREETLASFLLCVTTLNRPWSRRGRKAEVDAGARGEESRMVLLPVRGIGVSVRANKNANKQTEKVG